MSQPKTLIKTEIIEDFLIHETFVSLDESSVTINVSLNNRKFVVSKEFSNNTFGMGKIEEFKNSLSSIDKFKTYLGV